MSALDRLKNIQSNFKRTWNGINCEYSGRSGNYYITLHLVNGNLTYYLGTSNFVNKKRTFHIPESYYEEEERQRQLAKVFCKLRDLEDDKSLNNATTQNSTSSFNKTASTS